MDWVGGEWATARDHGWHVGTEEGDRRSESPEGKQTLSLRGCTSYSVRVSGQQLQAVLQCDHTEMLEPMALGNAPHVT